MVLLILYHTSALKKSKEYVLTRLFYEFNDNEAVDFSSLRVTHVVFEYIAVVFIDLMHFNLWKVWVHFSVSVRHSEDSRLPVGLPPGLHIDTRD